MWSVKHKTLDRKHFKLGVLLAEFHMGTFGLGFEFHHSSNRATHRYGHYAHVVIHFTWVEVILSLEWGHKAQWDRTMARLRENRTA